MKVIMSNVSYPEVDQFIKSVRDIGDPVEVEIPRPAALQAAGGYESVVHIVVDPETLKQIFEYTALLLGTYKATNYVGEFFLSAIKKSGEIAGAKLVEVLGSLWKGLNHRVMEDNAKGGYTRVYLTLDIPIDEDCLSVNNSIFASTHHGLSNEDHEQSFYLVFLKLLPFIREYVIQCRLNRVKIDKLGATFVLHLDGTWSWRVDVYPIGVFTLAKGGRFLSAYPLEFLGWRYFAKRRFTRKGISENEIAFIVRLYAKSKG